MSGQTRIPSNNIIPSLDQADKDVYDDGLISPPVLPTTFCSQITFTYSVSFAAVTTQPLYVNIWFDFNQDGDWQDSGRCAVGPTTTGLLSEWAVQDQDHPGQLGPGAAYRDHAALHGATTRPRQGCVDADHPQ